MTIIGIDFGNLNTKVFKIKNGHPEIVFDEQSSRVHHSGMIITGDNRFFGQIAFDKKSKYFKNYIYHLKNWIISDNKNLDIYPFYTSDDFGDNINKLDKSHFFSIFLNYLKKLIGENCLQCVISFPKNLSNETLNIIKRGFEISEIKLITIIDDCVACCVDYGFKRLMTGYYRNKEEIICHIDAGHLSFKATLVKFSEERIEVINSLYDYQISGHIITNILLSRVISDINSKYGINIKNYGKYLFRLYNECEKAKKSLSVNRTTYLNMDIFLEGKEIVYTYQFNREYISENLDWAKYLSLFFGNLIFSYIKGLDEISRFVVTGGNVRVPYLRNILDKITNCKLETTVNIDESIARGCSIIGALHSEDIITKAKFGLYYKSSDKIMIKWDNMTSVELFSKHSRYPAEKKITIRSINNMGKLLGFRLEILNNDLVLSNLVLKAEPNPVDKFSGNEYIIVGIKRQIDGNCFVKEVNLVQEKSIKVLDGGIEKIVNKKVKIPINFLQTFRTNKIDNFRSVEKIREFENKENEADRLKQFKSELINNLESDYYKYQELAESDDYITFYSPNELQIQNDKVSERLEILYNNSQDIDTLEDYKQELLDFNNILVKRKEEQVQFWGLINNLNEKYPIYQKEINKLFTDYQKCDGDRKKKLEYFKSQLESEWNWFQNIYKEQKQQKKYNKLVTSTQVIQEKINNLESIFNDLSTGRASTTNT